LSLLLLLTIASSSVSQHRVETVQLWTFCRSQTAISTQVPVLLEMLVEAASVRQETTQEHWGLAQQQEPPQYAEVTAANLDQCHPTVVATTTKVGLANVVVDVRYTQTRSMPQHQQPKQIEERKEALIIDR
jgi:hypothetical protein